MRENHQSSNLARSVRVAWHRQIHREAEPIAQGVLLYKSQEHFIRKAEDMYVQISFYTMFKRNVPDKSGNYRWPYFPSSKLQLDIEIDADGMDPCLHTVI